MDWYLMYKTTNAALANATSGSDASSNSLSCYLLPDNSYSIKQTGTSTVFAINLTDYGTQDRQFYFMGNSGGKVTFSCSSINAGYGVATVNYNNHFVGWNINNVSLTLNDSFTSTDDHTLTCVSAAYVRVAYYGKDYLMPVGIYKDSTNNKFYSGYFYNSDRVMVTGTIADQYQYIRLKYVSSSSFSTANVSTLYTTTTISDLLITVNNQFGTYRAANYWIDLGSTGTNTISGDQSVLKLYQNVNGATISTAADITNLSIAFDNGTDSSTAIVKGYNALLDSDLSDSKLVKILELPYCPSNIIIKNNSYVLNSNFVYDSINQNLKYTNLRERFAAQLNDYYLNKLVLQIPSSNPGSRALTTKSPTREPKLLHSDFYINKLVYDGNYKQIKFETIQATGSNLPILTITFSPTNTIGSDLAFIFGVKNAVLKAEYDYPVLLSNRDNSLPIYNNDYINYMRYTYATDRANLDASARQANTSGKLGIIGSVAGAVGSGTLIGALTSGAPGAIIGAVVSAATSIMSSVNSYVQATTNVENANRSLNSKMINLENQPVTASGAASAIDLMKLYSNNKLHVMTYTPTSLFQSALYDKLFYCGYSHPVQGIPDFTSRCWFNFVQCDPVFNDSSVYNKYLDDIKERFKIGVTVYHYHPNLTDTGYDWDQTYEN